MFNSEAVAWSPDGRVIALCEQKGSGGNLYHIIDGVDVNGGQERPIGSAKWGYIGGMAWLRDGSDLVLTGNSPTGSNSQIWEVSYPSGQARRITNDLSSYFDLSLTADSAALVTAKFDRSSNIWTVPQGNSDHSRQVTFGTTSPGQDGITWLQGAKVLYATRADQFSQLWTVDASGGNPQQLAPEMELSAVDEYSASACGEGRPVALSVFREGKSNIWTVNADGSQPRQLTHTGTDIHPACSPQGKWVVFMSLRGGQVAIWKIPVEGGKAVPLTDYTSQFPAVSPDGKWVAFLDVHNLKNPRLAVMSIDGGPPVKSFSYTANVPGNPYFQWSPDGRSIDYVDDRKGVCNIWAQPLAGGPPKQITHFNSGLIFNFAWSKKGDLALSRGSETSDAVLIKNF
jgi:Tol biopolymer transport system component